MKRWPEKALGELCDVQVGRTPRRDQPRFWGGTAVWVTIRELNGGVISSSKENISDIAVHECMPEPVPAGTLLFSFKLSIGKMAVTGCPLYTNEAIAALPIKEPAELSLDFLRYALLRQSHEGTANLAVLGKVLNKEKVQQLSIPVPPTAEQERIVDVLNNADDLRKIRAQADRRTSQLIPALFNEMFGDPATNPLHWPSVTLGGLVRAAQDGPHVSPKYAPSGVPFLSTRHIKPGRVVWEDLKFLAEEEAAVQWKKCKPEKGDVLYTKGGTTGIAAAVTTDVAFAVWVHVAVLKTNLEKANPIWLENMLNSPFCYQQSQELTHGIANRDLGLTRMTKLRIYQPPLSLQEEFAERVAEIRELEASQVSSRARLDALFQSTLHRGFAGEL